MSQQVKILAFPIFRRYWLYHAWQDPSSLAVAASTVKDWRKGVNLEERLSLLGQQSSTWVRRDKGLGPSCLQVLQRAVCMTRHLACRRIPSCWHSGATCRLPRRAASSTGCTGKVGARLPQTLSRNLTQHLAQSHACRRYTSTSWYHGVMLAWCRLAQGVRSKEEPEETFLKSVPSDVERLEIIYPVKFHLLAVSANRTSFPV